jgi:hypothetical protein
MCDEYGHQNLTDDQRSWTMDEGNEEKNAEVACKLPVNKEKC